MSSRQLALVLAGATALVLLAMVALAMATGASQEVHEHYAPPDVYAAGLLAHPGALRGLMGLDIAFLCLYTAFFAALGDHLRWSTFAKLGFAAMLGTAVLDIVEDHRILASLGLAEAGHPIDDGTIAFQQVLSSTKFSVSYLALVAFGLAIPRSTRLGVALCLFLTIGTLATGALGYAAPPSWRESLDGGRWVGFLAGFALAAAWLHAQGSGRVVDKEPPDALARGEVAADRPDERSR